MLYKKKIDVLYKFNNIADEQVESSKKYIDHIIL